MAESGRLRRHELNDSMLGSRRRSGSEAIRKRVNQLLQSATIMPRPNVISMSDRSRVENSSSDTWPKSDTSIQSSASTSHHPNSLKRKESSSSHLLCRSDRVDNNNGDTIQTSMICHPSGTELSLYSSNKIGPSVVAKNPNYQHGVRNFWHNGDSDDEEEVYNEPITVMEFERMKKEVKFLKEALHESTRACKRHTKKLEDIRSELSLATKTIQDRDLELTALQMEHGKNRELLRTIEASIQCQICMDLSDRPFALAPCGHVLCLSCLQEWFRKAPPTLDDLDVDPEELTDPHYVLLRSKSCPSCRAVIKHRPVPVFMIKAVAVALQKARAYSSISHNGNNHADAENDPWKGIFPSSDEDVDEDDSSMGDAGDSDSDYELQHEFRTAINGWYRRRAQLSNTIDTSDDSQGDDEENDADNTSEDGDIPIFTRPRWAPPSVTVDPAAYDLSDEGDPSMTLKLLQRGCTWDMLQSYEIAYQHSSGIILSLRSLDHIYASDDDGDGEEGDVNGMNRIFLGWNIILSEDDVDGEVFINEILEDIKAAPARWKITPRVGVFAAMDVRKLIRADDVEEYETTDTEVWVDWDV